MAHLMTDWILQNGWMARNKVRLRHPTARTRVITRGVCLRLALVWFGAPIAASGAAAPGGDESLEVLLARTNIVFRAFVKDRQIRFYLASGIRCWILKAEWERARAPAQEFSYAAATLKAGKPPKQMPEPPAKWHEVKVIAKAESEQFLHAAAEHLIPAKPGHGVHCQYALGDAVLFRNAAGDVQLIAADDKPADVVIHRRYTRHELASVGAEALETDLTATYPGQNTFLLIIGTGGGIRLSLFNLSEREVVVLYVPMADNERRLAPPLGTRLSNLASFVLVDNALAFLKSPVYSSARAVNQWVQWPFTFLTDL